MAKKEKEVTAPPEEKKEEKPETPEEEADDEEEEPEKPPEENIDWKKIADEERERRTKAEKALAEDRYKAKERKEEEGEEEEEEMDKPITGRQLDAILRRNTEETKKEFLSTRIREEARNLAGSEEEAEAIVEIHRNRLFPSNMPLESQVREAYFIAHGPVILAKNSELKRSLASKDTANKGGAENTFRDAPAKGEPKISQQDRAEFARLGFEWDGKFFSKKTAKGRTLSIDPKSKKTFVR